MGKTKRKYSKSVKGVKKKTKKITTKRSVMVEKEAFNLWFKIIIKKYKYFI